MKKFIAAVLAVCIVGGTAPALYQYAPNGAITANAADYTEVTEGSLTFKVYSTYAELSNCDGTEANVEISSEVNGVPVISIGEGAFYDYYANRCAAVESITIPDTVVNIGEKAFRNLTSLTSIEVPDSVTTLGRYAFWGCSSLTSAKLPDKLTSVPEGTFVNCVNLADVNIPKSAETIGAYAFANTALTSLTIPGNVKSIVSNSQAGNGNGLTGSFEHCQKLETVVIEEGVVDIGYNTFDDCSALFTVTIPSTAVFEAGGSMFNGGPFNNCTSLKNVSIAEGAKIGKEAYLFQTCEALEEIVLPESFGMISNGMFLGCKSLKSVTIPDSYTYIGGSAFSGCTALEEVNIPEKVTSISQYAFSDCSSLTEIELPKSVATVEHRAFQNCAKLEKITFYNSNCDIDMRCTDTICNYVLNDVPYFNGTIVGYAGSTAQAFAENYGYKFEELPLAKGDVNGDTLLDSSDAAMTLQHYAVFQSDGVGKFTEQQLAVADFNDDSLIDSSDAALILKTYAENQSK